MGAAGESTFRSLGKNSLAMVLCRIATAAASLLTIPFVISAVGVAGYGIWESMLAVAAIGMMVQQAVAATLLWRVSSSFGANDFDGIRRSVRVGSFGLTALAIFLIALAWTAKAAFPVHRLLPWVVTIYVAASFNEVLASVISGCQRMREAVYAQSAGVIFGSGVSILGVSLGYGLDALAVGAAVGFFVAFIALLLLARRACPDLTLTPARPDRAEIGEYGRYWGLLMVGNVSQALRDQTDKLVLVALASPTWVGYYGVAARLAALVLETTRFFYGPLVAAAGASHGAQDWEGVRGLYRRLTTIMIVAGGAVAVVTAGLGDRLIVLWLGRPMPEASFMLFLLIVGNTAAVLLTGVGSAICRAVGRVGIETRYVLVNLFLNLALTITLVLTLGPIGTVIASGASWAVASLYFSFILQRHLDLPAESTLRSRWALVVASAIAAATAIGSRALPQSADRTDAALSLAWLAPLTVLVYLALVVLTRLVPKSSINRLKSRIREGASPA